MKPFVKWAGGKRQLLEEIKNRMPQRFNTYIEPFVGGGAVFLDLECENAIINDSNEQLINCYEQIRNNLNELILEINELDSMPCSKERYLELRSSYNKKIENKELDVQCAALLIWLNKHCFNGLYRTNRKGFFNTPWNNKENGDSIDVENLVAMQTYLCNRKETVKVLCGDYKAACDYAKKGDFIFIDPPYDPVGEYGDFKRYTKEQFGEDDQKTLAETVRMLAAKGCYVMVTNSNTPLINKLYQGYRIEIIPTKRNISSKGNRRRGEDVIITTY